MVVISSVITTFLGNIVDSGHGGSMGLFVCMAGTFLNALRKYDLEAYKLCKQLRRNQRSLHRNIRISADVMKRIPDTGIQKTLFAQTDCVVPVEFTFAWNDVDTVLDVERLENKPEPVACD